MKHFLLTFLVSIVFFTSGYSQLPSGTIAPAFTVTDLDGNTHDLYSYLNNGVSVVIDVSATWCGPCWSYHNSGTLENFYNSYGPGGTGDVMVIFAEGDAGTNLECLYGPSGCVGGTQGNWVAGTPYPITHTGGPTIASLYQIAAYPTIFMISAGNNRSYTTGGGGVSSTVLQNYVLHSFKMAATADVADAVCGGDGSITLTVTEGYGNKTYAWSNGSNTKDLTNVNPGVYVCSITDANNYQIVTDAFVVGGTQVPVSAYPTLAVQPSCYGGTNGSVGVLGTAGNGGYTYLWDPSAGLSDINIAQPIVKTTNTTTYTLTVNGICTYPQVVNVDQTPPLADAGPNTTIDCATQSIQLGTPAVAGYTYRWEPAATLDNPNIAQPIASPKTTTIYTLTVTGPNGCTSSSSCTIMVDECCTKIVIPNSFSPNGDQLNDKFGVVEIENLRGFTLSVYNRWGQKLFETQSKDVRWDGTYKGVKCEVGTYFYLCTYDCANKEEKFQLQGDINLIR